MSISKEEAQEIAAQLAAEKGAGIDLTLLADQTEEREFGWVFYFANSRLVDAGNPYEMVAGMGPLVVNRDDGAARFLTTSVTPDAGISNYEEKWREQHRS